MTVYACGLPQNQPKPTFVSSSSSQITIEWNQPEYDGGCAIFDYEVQRDADGTGTTWTEVNPSSSYTRQDPYNREFECTTFPVGATAGDQFKFRIIAYNLQGSTTSDESVIITLASVPGTPAAAPTYDAAYTSSSQIKVTLATVADNGGSSILSYELQMGTLSLNDFVSISGEDPYSLSTSILVTDVEKGETYTFKYRAINAVGPGEWSDILAVKAASVPQAPPQP